MVFYLLSLLLPSFMKICTLAGPEILTMIYHGIANDFPMFFFVALFFYTLRKLILSNDIETNPGPGETSQKFLSAVYVNLRSITSIPTKLHELCHLVDNELPAFIGIGETWLDDTIDEDDIAITNYPDPIRKDKGRDGCGVMLYIRDDIAFSRVYQLENAEDESIWISYIHPISKQSSLFGFYYRTPSMSSEELKSWLTRFDQALFTAKAMKPKSINVLGDLNGKTKLWYADGTENIAGTELLKIISKHGMVQLIDEPTRFCGNSKSLIDLFITDSPTTVMKTEVFPRFLRCDHCPILAKLSYVLPPSKKTTRTHYMYDKIDMDTVRANFSQAPFEVILDTFDNIDDAVHAWVSLFLSVVKETIPNKLVTIDRRSKPWFNDELKFLRKRMLRLRKRSRTKKDANAKLKAETIYEDARELYHNKIDEACMKYDLYLADKVIKGNMKEKTFWTITRKLLNKPSANSIPPLKHNDTIYASTSEKSNILNSYFCDQSSLDDTNMVIPPMPNYIGHEFLLEPTTEEEVGKLLSALDASKATGPDGIPARILKLASVFIAPSLAKIFNKCMAAGYFPSSFKKAHVVPIYKKGDKQNPGNYRPVALTNHLAKIFEKLIYTRFYKHLNERNFLSPQQSGFRKNDSTVNQMIKLTHEISFNLNNRKETKAVYLDISKAFDKVWHRGLLLKLEHLCGVNATALKFFKSYLTDRKQRVILDGDCSEWGSTTAGVPQGSILGPLLFLVFINDVTKLVSNSISLFADDTSLSRGFSSEDSLHTKESLETDLRNIKSWGDTWAVTFNPVKTISLLYSRKDVKSVFPLSFGDVVVSDSTSHKHLGIILKPDLNWEDQALSCIAKAERRIPMFAALKHKLSSRVLLAMYSYFIRPLLEYGDVIWDNLTQDLVKSLETVQNQCLIIVSGCTQGTNCDKLRSLLGMNTLEYRRKLHRLCHLFKMIKSEKIPPYLKQLLDQRPLRRSARLQTVECPKSDSGYHRNSFLVNTICDWNSLKPASLRSINSLENFKKEYRKYHGVESVPELPLVQPRSHEIILNKFRADFTELHDDKHRHGYPCTPNCSCGFRLESHFHFFFDCPRYTNVRTILFDKIEPMLKMPVTRLKRNKVFAVKFLVYGTDEIWINRENTIDFLHHIVEFIIHSRRFQ